jgi:transposase
VAIDPRHLPNDPQALQRLVLELFEQLNREAAERSKLEALVRELLDAKRGRKSEQLSKDQLALFAALWEERQQQREAESAAAAKDSDDDRNAPGSPTGNQTKKPGGGRQSLPKHLKRERIVHDLAEAGKHCAQCSQDLRHIGEEVCERYEYVPASLTVIEDVCLKYACGCTIHTATKPAQPIEKSVAGSSLLAQVIVSKFADHLPLHRQEKIFERHGADISRKTMGDWLAASAVLIEPLYSSMKDVLFQSKVIGTDDTPVKVLDPKLPFARTGRIWPYCGDRDHPVILYDYTATRERAGPEKFLQDYRGYLQADAYGGYDAFFKDPKRGLIEVACWAHTRRYFFKAVESDQKRMGPVLLLISELYRIEERARGLDPHERLRLRQAESIPILNRLHDYLMEIQIEVTPKSPEGRAVRYALKNWTALTRYAADGDLEIDNNATERVLRGVAVGRNNWTFFGSDAGGRTAAVLRSFVASCERVKVDPFVWFKDVLSRIAGHPINRIAELLPHNWTASQA